WTRTYEKDSLYDWLLSQKKFTYTPVSLSAATLKQFAGTYITAERDTALLWVDGDTLRAKSHGEQANLLPYGTDVFFIDKRVPVDFQFTRNRKGKVEQFSFYSNRNQMLFRKVD
ncbi:MAG TPA: DUF3471 domain-containing protein, partial [Puia sp.]|nr:DUF3471 domain-containing protein [Puia sp.]